jgi:SAM-dependent methyltransferase
MDKNQSLAQKIVMSIRTVGAGDTLKRALGHILNVYYEWYFGVTTAGILYPRESGFDNPEFQEYAPTEFYSFMKMLKTLNITKNDVFLDYGSGMGRALIMAAMHPFRRVIGVELLPELNAVAAENIEKSRKFFKCQHIDIHESDAAAYIVPQNVTIIYFYFPFRGTTLSKVLDNIENSLIRSPREITIIYKNPPRFDEQAADRNWLKKCSEYKPFYGHKYVIYKAAVK